VVSIGQRFEANVDRSGEHHLWCGYIAPDGTAQIRVNGRLTTARRLAWELVHGPLPHGVNVPDVSCSAVSSPKPNKTMPPTMGSGGTSRRRGPAQRGVGRLLLLLGITVVDQGSETADCGGDTPADELRCSL
jgi:hypothetical protein